MSLRVTDAMGNAWFINDVQFVPTPDDECAALNTLDLHKTAVADEKFREVLTCTGIPNAEDKIEMTKYQPNELTYSSNTASDRITVFSEIFYPEGWHLTVDGEEYPIGRVNYVLRAAVIPAGKHIIKMHFVPNSLRLDKWSYACIIILLLCSIVALTYPLWRKLLHKSSAAPIATSML